MDKHRSRRLLTAHTRAFTCVGATSAASIEARVSSTLQVTFGVKYQTRSAIVESESGYLFHTSQIDSRRASWHVAAATLNVSHSTSMARSIDGTLK